jgi:hypothetical protein
MENVEMFIKSMVKIEFIEKSNCFGMYPFQLFSEDIDGKQTVQTLLLGGNVKSCYEIFNNNVENCKKVYMALDFPKLGDIENDFIAVFSFENNEYKVIAIPYTTEGKVLEFIKEAKAIDKIKSQIMLFKPKPLFEIIHS